jgi:hypothetical protein
MEMILMVDFASTQAQANEVAPPASREGANVTPTFYKNKILPT